MKASKNPELTKEERQAAYIQETHESRERHIKNAVELLKRQGYRVVKLEPRMLHPEETTWAQGYTIGEEL